MNERSDNTSMPVRGRRSCRINNSNYRKTVLDSEIEQIVQKRCQAKVQDMDEQIANVIAFGLIAFVGALAIGFFWGMKFGLHVAARGGSLW